MALRTYFVGVGWNAGLTLLCALPFVLIALWRTRARAWRPVLLVGALVVFQNAVFALPRVSWLQHFHWHWQESLLTVAWVLLLVARMPGLSLASLGVTTRMTPGWFKPSLVALAIAGGVPLVFFALGSRLALTAEGWIYLLVMPGLAEELLFRGLYQRLLNDAFGRPWRLGGAEFGWGLLITSVLFAGANGMVAVDDQLHARLALPAAIAPFLMGLVSGWVRERTNSVWPSVAGHNLSNLMIPLATLVARATGR